MRVRFRVLSLILLWSACISAACSSSDESPGANTNASATTGSLDATTGTLSTSAGGAGTTGQTATTGSPSGATTTGGSTVGGGGATSNTTTTGVTTTGGGTSGAAAGGANTTAGGTGGASTAGSTTTGGAGVGGSTDTGGSGGMDDGIVVPVASTPDERHFLVRDEGNSQLHYIDLGAPENNWHVDVPAGRELQLIGNNRLLIGTENGYEERSVVDGGLLSEMDSFPATVAALRLRNGNTLLVGAEWQGETGITLLEVDASGVEQGRINYPQFDYVRLVRPTPSGTYLLTSNITIFEGDTAGNILWQVAVQDSTEAHAWKALRLPSGETVVATGYEASLQFFDSSQEFVRRIRGPSTVTPNFYCDFQILTNGNYLITNWQGHGTGNGNLGHQIVELDPQGNLVWSWQQDPSYISSIQATILLDGLNLGKLHVEDTNGQLVPVE